ncbi:MAG: DUF4838 domain-containing protein [Candidatus Hydrogenedentes bacterium]|nr:DUF4838 domain-containing protein [Candidatus Hydrogenedentota bacterium]
MPRAVLILSLVVAALIAPAEPVAIVLETGAPAAVLVLPDAAEPVVAYAAEEFADHVARATGATLATLSETDAGRSSLNQIHIGPTRAAADAGIDVAALPGEAFVLRTAPGRVFIAAEQGSGDPLSTGAAGALWGVYEVLERSLGVRWLWPGELGTVVPRRAALIIGPFDETIPPRYQQRQLRPSLGLRGFTEGDPRLGFSEAQRAVYAREQSVFLRRHRMGRTEGTYFASRKFGSGHAFEGWWEEYGAEHPEWFQQNPDGSRGPEDPSRPKRVSMCVSNPALAEKVVERWAAERAERPGEPLGLGIGESDGSAMCVCAECRSWDDPMPDSTAYPAGLERSFEPVQAGARYARFAARVHELAARIDPEVKVHFYAYLNYFWAPQDVTLHPNIIIGFVPWFRWAGWFPRTDEEQAWIKAQWDGWQRTGVSAYYRPNWFLDGYSMPLVYTRQFADAFQHYHRNGMMGTDFDSLQGMWAAQGPNLYTLARIHVRPDAPLESILDEYYAAFGPAADAVRDYFQFWENYATQNSPVAADAIRSRRGGNFRRYALYALVADELYPPSVFPSGFGMLDIAEAACAGEGDPVYAGRVRFLRAGLEHALKCVETAAIMNDPSSTAEARGAALSALAAYRQTVESLGIANMDRAAIIETDSWKEVAGFRDPWASAP